jgi:hypothetical protein
MGKWYYCKYCGTKFKSVIDLTGSCCCKNPYAKNHALYEGDEKPFYVCKYCGRKESSLALLSLTKCSQNPAGTNHEPL